MNELFEAAARTTLNAGGNGSVRIHTNSLKVDWRVDSASVATSTNQLEPTATLTLNGTQVIGGTYTGSNDTTDLDIVIQNGFIECTWTDGDPGASATLFIKGRMGPRGAFS